MTGFCRDGHNCDHEVMIDLLLSHSPTHLIVVSIAHSVTILLVKRIC